MELKNAKQVQWLDAFFVISFPSKTKISQRRDMSFWKLGNELIKLIA